MSVEEYELFLRLKIVAENFFSHENLFERNNKQKKIKSGAKSFCQLDIVPNHDIYSRTFSQDIQPTVFRPNVLLGSISDWRLKNW